MSAAMNIFTPRSALSRTVLSTALSRSPRREPPVHPVFLRLLFAGSCSGGRTDRSGPLLNVCWRKDSQGVVAPFPCSCPASASPQGPRQLRCDLGKCRWDLGKARMTKARGFRAASETLPYQARGDERRCGAARAMPTMTARGLGCLKAS